MMLAIVGHTYYLSSLPKSSTFAMTAKQNLELQAMCSKGAKDFFNRNYPEPISYIPGINDFSTYKNHYNRTLNKCFILIDTHRSSGSGENLIVSDATWLYDAYEDKNLASLSSGPYRVVGVVNTYSRCDVLGKVCKVEDFQSLIKPYMEE